MTINNTEVSEEIFDTYLNSRNIEEVSDNKLLNYALHYAKCGYPVFPLQNIIYNIYNNGKGQCSCSEGLNCSKKPGKHPRTRYGLKEATTDENKIFDWWEKYPNANIGLLTGKEVGFWVLDIDVKTEYPSYFNGEMSLEEMQEDYRSIMKEDYDSPATLGAISGSGSRHLYFKYQIKNTIKSSASKLNLGLDIKSDDSYIIAPPSNHISGGQYQWFGCNTAIEDAPEWLIYEITKLSQKREEDPLKSAESQFQSQKYPTKINDGEGRHRYFVSYISGLVNSFSEDEVMRRAISFNDNVLVPPFPQHKVEYQVKYLYLKYGNCKTTLNNLKNIEKDIGLKK